MLLKVDERRWCRTSTNYDRCVYASYWISHTLKDCLGDNNLGYTNEAGMRLTGDINLWLKKATPIIWKLFAVRCLFSEVNDISNKNKCIKVLKGFSAQRRLMRGLKYVVKKNPLDKLQAQVVAFHIKKCSDRLVYLEKAFLPTVSESSTILYYFAYLEKEGLTMGDELSKFFGENYINMKIEEEGEAADAYYQHVKDTISLELGREDIAEKISVAKAREQRMHEESVASAIRYQEAQKQKCYDDAMALVNALTSRAQKTVIRVKTPRTFKNYICVAAYVPPNTTTKHFVGYVHGSERNIGISKNPANAKLYRTEEDAKAAAELLVNKSTREVIYNIVPVYKAS